MESFFFATLITGLSSDRSPSKSYKLEGGGWNGDWATLSQSLSLFHFSPHKHTTSQRTQKATHMHCNSKHFSRAKNRSNTADVTQHKHGSYCCTLRGLTLAQLLAQLTKATMEPPLSSQSHTFTHTTTCSNNQQELKCILLLVAQNTLTSWVYVNPQPHNHLQIMKNRQESK